ncbi:MAG: hypothetical protein JXR56_03100 [Candidatus Cloacimonetes bacterium]|nr:hypothetical protein [Candidatus Cloacimonadota bacterium]
MIKYSTSNQTSTKSNHKNIYKTLGNNLFKKAKASTQMMRSPKGWAVDKAILDKAIQSGLEYMVIFEEEFSLYYRSLLSDFYAYGKEIEFKNFGKQIVLPIKHWQITSPGQPFPAQLELQL